MPIAESVLKKVVLDQQAGELLPTVYMQRDLEPKIISLGLNREIIVLTGIRRCGKSVLQQFVRSRATERDYYLNFEDERLVNFTLEDFQSLQELFISLFGEQKHYYFDEIQNIEVLKIKLKGEGKNPFAHKKNILTRRQLEKRKRIRGG